MRKRVYETLAIILVSLFVVLMLEDHIDTSEHIQDGVEHCISVQPKEVIMCHQYTEEEMQEELYDDSLELLAICVEAEAGSQDILGKRYVVDVILNRVDSERFPNNITDVIQEPYQFTSYWDGHMDRILEPSEETFEAVRMELRERTNSEVLFFTEGRYNPYCEPLFVHGAHYFGR